MPQLKFVLAALLFATPAFAQGSGDGEGDASAGGEAGAGVDANAGAGVGVGTDGTGEAAAAAGGDMSLTGWGKAVMNRSYTLLKGAVAVTGDIYFGKISVTFFNPVTMMNETSTATGAGLGLGGHYGISDKLMAGATYGLSLKEFEAKGPLTIYGAFQLAHDLKMSVAATASFTYDLAGETMGIAAGLGLRFNVNDKIAVFTGAPFGPGPVGQHLNISLEDMGPITFDVLAGAGFQATPELFAYLSTNLAHISISNSANGFIGADFFPLTLGALFGATDKIDVTGGFVLPDLKNAKFDAFALHVGAIVRL